MALHSYGPSWLWPYTVMALLPPSQNWGQWAVENPSFWKKIDKTTQNRVLCGRGFLAMCNVPSLDNVILIDFAVQCCIILRESWVALYPCHQFWRFCGIHIDSLGSLWLSLESSGVGLAPKKNKFYEISIFDSKNLFLNSRPGSKSLLPRRRNQDWPQRLKSVWHTAFGP